jgi:hypothetical protein
MKRIDPPKPSGKLLPPAIILGTPAAAGLNQKNSTSLPLGTQTAFDFYPPTVCGGFIRQRNLADLTPYCNRCLYPKMLNGAPNPPEGFGGSNLLSHFVTYFWDATPISKMHFTSQSSPAGWCPMAQLHEMG